MNPIKNIFVTIIFALLLSCSSFAQGPKAPTQHPVPVKTPPKQNVRIVLSTKAAKYTGDENIFLEITLENLGDTGFSFPDQAVESFYQIQLTEPESKVPLTPKIRGIMSSGGYHVPAHGKISAAVWLNHMFDVSKIGTYTVKVSTNFDFADVRLDASSEPLTFELTSYPTLSGWQYSLKG